MAVSETVIGILLQARNDTKAAFDETKGEMDGLKGSASETSTSFVNLALAGLSVAGALKFGQQVYELAQLGAQAQKTENAFNRLASNAQQSGSQILEALKKATSGTISDQNLELDVNKARVLGVADSVDKLAKLFEIAKVRGAEFGETTQQAFDDLTNGIGRASPKVLDNLGFTNIQAGVEAYAQSIGKAASELTNAEQKQALFNVVSQQSANDLKSVEGSAKDTSEGFEKLSTSADNAKVALGKLLAPSVSGAATGLSGALDAATGLFNRAAAAQQNAAIDATKAKLGELIALKEKLDSGGGGLGFFQGDKGIEQLTAQIDDLKKSLAQLEQANQSSSAALQTEASAAGTEANAIAQASAANLTAAGTQATLKAGVDAVTASIDAERGAVLSLAGALPALASAASAANAATLAARNSAVSRLAGSAAGVENIVGETEAQNQFGQAVDLVDAKYQALNQQLADGNITTDQFQLKIAELGNVGNDAFEQIHKSQQEAESSAKKYASTLENDVKKAYDHIQGSVDGVVKSALNLGDIGVDPDKILKDPKNPKSGTLLERDDAINENARRIADIAVNGFKGQDWLGKLKAALPDVYKAISESGDPRASAAEYLKRFQDGLEPELIDKEKAKERVRKMLLGEAKIGELVKEITGELSKEFGNTAPADIENLVKGSFGLKGTDSQSNNEGSAASGKKTGAAFGQSVLAGVGNLADRILSELENDLKADTAVARLKNGGNASGTVWGSGFLDSVGNNVPKALIDLLTNLIRPGLINYNQTQTQLTGTTP